MIGIVYGALRRDGADRHEEAGRLLVGQPPRLRACSGIFALTTEQGSRAACSRWSTTASRPARSSSWSACSTSGATRGSIADFGGLGEVDAGLLGALPASSCSASIGLPGLNGFVGEFLILLGAFRSGIGRRRCSARPASCSRAVYMLWMYRRVIFGPVGTKKTARSSTSTCARARTLVAIVLRSSGSASTRSRSRPHRAGGVRAAPGRAGQRAAAPAAWRTADGRPAR